MTSVVVREHTFSRSKLEKRLQVLLQQNSGVEEENSRLKREFAKQRWKHLQQQINVILCVVFLNAEKNWPLFNEKHL